MGGVVVIEDGMREGKERSESDGGRRAHLDEPDGMHKPVRLVQSATCNSPSQCNVQRVL
ncbi:hypothetical protein SAY86_007020 [Trapa natans]|uniref:Uncharacterized protein n=1 Tax=Trapa natans TaxID=22666 RepID=A0AAN7LKT0_TRANT|nr:hypothetical protein SAY86_007020 [Trapa natans]